MIAASAVVLIAVAVVLRAEDDPDLRLGIDVPAEH
jgi:hypothetical protein